MATKADLTDFKMHSIKNACFYLGKLREQMLLFFKWRLAGQKLNQLNNIKNKSIKSCFFQQFSDEKWINISPLIQTGKKNCIPFLFALIKADLMTCAFSVNKTDSDTAATVRDEPAEAEEALL